MKMRTRWFPVCACGYFILCVLMLVVFFHDPGKPFEFNIEIPTKHYFNCSNIKDIQVHSHIGAGYSKQAYLGYYKDQQVVVKGVSKSSHDVSSCLKRIKSEQKKLKTEEPHEKQLWRCITLPHMKLLKEILYMEQLYHPNIIPLLGYCVKNENPGNLETPLIYHGAVAVYKYGDDISVRTLSRLPVYRRLVAAVEFADVMHYLQFSPLGSLLFADFKSIHFLLVKGHVMLIDFDDVNELEPKCGVADKDLTESNEQDMVEKQTDKCRYGIECQNGLCVGVNALHNLKRTCQMYIRPIIKSLYSYDYQFSDSFSTDLENVNSYLTEIESAVGNSNNKAPPTALELKVRLEKLQEGILFKYSGRVTTAQSLTDKSYAATSTQNKKLNASVKNVQ